MQRSIQLITILGAVAFLGPDCLHAAGSMPDSPARRLTLQDALSLAKSQHLSSILANERVRQSIERVGQRVAPLLPQVRGTSSQSRETRNLQSLGFTLPDEGPVIGPFDVFDARVSVTQTIFDLTVIQRLRSAAAGRDQSEADRRKTEQDVLALVADLFIEADRAYDHIQYARALLRRDRKRLGIERERLGNGTGSDVGLKRAEADFSESRRALAGARAEYVERKLDLTAAIGLPAHENIVFVKDRLFENPELPTPAVVQEIKQTHLEVEVARAELRIREAERWEELAEFLPKISGFGDYGLSGKAPSAAETTYTIGIQGSISLFEGGATVFRAQEAESRIRESQATIRDLERRVEADILSGIQVLKSSLVAVHAREAQLAVASQENALARHRLASGTGSEVEVLDKAALESSARDLKLEAGAVYRLAQVQLLHALGQMDQLVGSP